MKESAFSGKRVLVTGATGFIGGRVVERLIREHGAEVVPLVRQFKGASRLSRFPVRMRAGDVTDEDSVRQAAEGCDFVIHCAVTFSGGAKNRSAVTLQGTENVCRVASSIGAPLVHLGTISTYGNTADGPLTEENRKRPADDYGKAKVKAEKIVLDHVRRGLQAVVLEPAIVYGPWSHWSSFPAMQAAAGRIVLPREGKGLCNAVYVDDVTEAIFAALLAPDAAGERFLVSGPEPVTWMEFYRAHLGESADEHVLCLSTGEVRKMLRREKWITPFGKLKKRLRSDRDFRREVMDLPVLRGTLQTVKHGFPGIASKIMGLGKNASGNMPGAADPLVLPDPGHMGILASRTEVSVEKARTGLGHGPAWSLERGSAMAREWLRWAGLV